MGNQTLNICQVSLNRDIPLILQNFENLKKFYKKIKIYIICPKHQINEFKSRLIFKEFEIIDEESLISLKEFSLIYKNLSKKISYKKKFEKRISWYYQQILKISFIIFFIKKNLKNIIIWDADTVILKKIKFFDKNNLSIKYGTFSEFHREYYLTNINILKKLPIYHISFLTQFIAISVEEYKFFIKNFFIIKKKIPRKLSKLILDSIFLKHKKYNGSMFSEYELLGQSNYLLSRKKQKPILSLRFGLNGKLSNLQINIIRFLNFKHITYEHSHKNKNSHGMLNRKQTWAVFFKLVFKTLFKFYLKSIKHFFFYIFYFLKKN